MIASEQVTQVIADPRVHAVTLTGSESAGRAIAAQAGQHLKKTVLELGGSDAFIVLEDAELDLTADNAIASRFLNAGQSCIAAKRFIVVDTVAEAFLERLKARVKALKPGDPLAEHTRLTPLARMDLRDQLHAQVTASIAAGAVAVTGCTPIPGPGAFYQASILDRVTPGMCAFDEEVFGPVAAVIRARDEEEAIRLANASPFGLEGSIWTGDTCPVANSWPAVSSVARVLSTAWSKAIRGCPLVGSNHSAMVANSHTTVYGSLSTPRRCGYVDARLDR